MMSKHKANKCNLLTLKSPIYKLYIGNAISHALCLFTWTWLISSFIGNYRKSSIVEHQYRIDLQFFISSIIWAWTLLNWLMSQIKTAKLTGHIINAICWATPLAVTLLFFHYQVMRQRWLSTCVLMLVTQFLYVSINRNLKTLNKATGYLLLLLPFMNAVLCFWFVGAWIFCFRS